ncbi:hypothetical protein BEQ56_11245 [Anaerolineaceae bacterium oral taxon 439]|nr:hypothetical protein BEQ56_11245 [Anaerolineaceae bacterium oral taxon 439]
MRSRTRRGTYLYARPARNDPTDLALDATLRAAAPYQAQRRTDNGDRRMQIRRADLMRKVRYQKTSSLLIFLLDLSWSMAVQQRVKATRGAILSLLTDAYQHRDRVALITFQKDRARLALPPTGSIMLAERTLRKVRVGGKTPLSAGLLKAHEVLARDRRFYPDSNALLVVLTDGDGNVSIGDAAPLEESKAIAERIAADRFRSIVIDMDPNAFAEGLANTLAKQLRAPYYQLAGLDADQLTRIIRREI